MPKPEVMLCASQDGSTRKDVYGRSFTQSSIEVAGTPEGVRVTIYGRGNPKILAKIGNSVVEPLLKAVQIAEAMRACEKRNA